MAANGHAHGNAKLELIRELEDLLQGAMEKLQRLDLEIGNENVPVDAGEGLVALEAYQLVTQEAAPLVHLATSPTLRPFIEERDVGGLAGQLTNDQAESVWSMPSVNAGELEAADSSQAEGKKKTVALVLILLHHMTNKHKEVLAATAVSYPALRSKGWEATRVYNNYNNLPLEHQVFITVMEGAQNVGGVTKYVKAAAFMLLARLLP